MRVRRWLLPALVVVLAGGTTALVLLGAGRDGGRPRLDVRFEPVVAGLERPVYLTAAGDGSGRLFVVEQPGRVRVVRDGALLAEPFLDIVPLVGSSGNEQGLLSIAFHPDYAANGRFFVDFTDRNGDSVIAEYRVSPADPDRADPASARRIMFVDQPAGNHNGGLLLFGPDGFLYIGFGDGGGGNGANGQRLDTRLGKILRIDVDHAFDDAPYGIPAGNPFVDTPGALPEIWLYGLRNPWRFAFDPASADLFVADVGSATWEEIDVVPAGTGGLNLGWNLFEGPDCILSEQECASGGSAEARGLTTPVAVYRHAFGNCSVSGGFVYRGSGVPSLRGTYLYGDYCFGRVWGLRRDSSGRWRASDPLETGLRISSFGEDETGELYVVDLQGAVYRVTSR